MTIDQDWPTTSKDYLTVVDQDNWIIFVSDGSTVTVARTDFGVEVHHVDPTTGETTDFDGSPFPYRAGAMETVRKWLAASNLAMVPSPEQAAAPWRNRGSSGGERATRWDHSYRKPLPASAPPAPAVAPPTPPPDFDPLAFAASLALDAVPAPSSAAVAFDAEAFAAQLAAQLKGDQS